MINGVKEFACKLAIQTGRCVTWTPEERKLQQKNPVWFSGEIPPMAGHEFNQYRVEFAKPRPVVSQVDDVIYTARGMAWVNGSLQVRYSLYEPSLKEIINKPRQTSLTYDKATIVQTQTPRTYGDWVSEQLCAICRAIVRGDLVEPVLLPGWWYRKPYVMRDLKHLGIDVRSVDEPVKIKHATVLHKTRNGHHWTRDEAADLLKAMRIEPRASRAGTALYISRGGEKGEGPSRQIRNDITEAAMKLAGVPVIRSAGRNLEEYLSLSEQAETVFADHGGACYNLIYWDTRRVVEFFTPHYWDPSYLFLCGAMGRLDYHLWRVDDNTSVEGLAERIRTLLSQPAGQPAIERLGDVKPTVPQMQTA